MSAEVGINNSKEAILDAAEQLIARHGYAGLSMRELSKHSGVAKSTLYHYFQDKREIYLNVLERDMSILEKLLTAAATGDESSTVEERLAAVIGTYIDETLARGIIALNALRRAGEFDAQLRDFFGYHREVFMRPFRTILHDGIRQGVISPDLNVDLAIMSLIGMMNSFLVQRLLLDCGLDDGANGRHDVDNCAGAGNEIPTRDEMVAHTLALYLHGIMQPARHQTT